MTNKKILGNKGEDIAVAYLKNKNYKIIQRNYHNRFVEIDIIAEFGDYIILVEVKTKTNSNFGTAVEMISNIKKKKLLKGAKFIQLEYPEKNLRIDVVAIDLANKKIDHYINAINEIN